SLAGHLETGDLQDDGGGLEYEDAAHPQSHDLLPDDHGDDAQRPADGQRTDIAHENLRGIRVEPQEAQARTGERRAENQELARSPDFWNLQIVGVHGIAA